MIDLPGPQFVSRPGWGGQVRQWCSRNAYQLAFRVILLAALVLIARSLWMRMDVPSAQVPTPTPQKQSVTLYARPGDGMTDVAARALNLYVAVQRDIVQLDAAQHLFAVDTLARAICWCPLERNQEITFSADHIGAIVTRALNLSPAQHAAWSRLLQ